MKTSVILAGVAAIAVAGSGAVVFVSRRGDEPKVAQVRPKVVTPPSESAVESTRPVTGDFQATRTAKWGIAASDSSPDRSAIDGLKVSLTAQIGETVEPGGTLPSDFAALQSVCAYNPATDLAIPIRTTLRNGEVPSVTLQYEMQARGFSEAPPELGLFSATQYGADDNCTDLNDIDTRPMLFVRYDGLSGAHTSPQNWLVIVTGYISPNYPKGQPSVIDGLRLSMRPRIEGPGGGAINFEQTCYSGRMQDDYLIDGSPLEPSFPLRDPDTYRRTTPQEQNDMSRAVTSEHLEREGIPTCS